MAGELQCVAPTGSVVYAQDLDRRNGKIWNTGTPGYEVYLTANIAAYALAMVELGAASGIFVGNRPVDGRPPGLAIYRIQAGGGPAEADVVIGCVVRMSNRRIGRPSGLLSGRRRRKKVVTP